MHGSSNFAFRILNSLRLDARRYRDRCVYYHRDVHPTYYARLSLRASPSYSYPFFVWCGGLYLSRLPRISSMFFLSLSLASNPTLPDPALSRRDWDHRLNLCSLTLISCVASALRTKVFKKLDSRVSVGKLDKSNAHLQNSSWT